MQQARIGNKPERVFAPVINGESAAIPVGTPVIYDMDGSDDGSEVVLPSSSTAAKATSFVAGIISGKDLPIDLPKTGRVQVYGLCNTVKIVRATRAATTDSYASYPAWAQGDRLIIDTVANAISRSDAGVASVLSPGFAAAETLASGASQASSTSITHTAITAISKVFLRLC